MSKVTSKLQVSVPKSLANQYGIRPGDDLEWRAAGDVIHVIPPGQDVSDLDRQQRLWLFDQATTRQQKRDADKPRLEESADRGWSRDELYENRGSTR
jgi:AbrB family looped-hinge helix DNA binding protein